MLEITPRLFDEVGRIFVTANEAQDLGEIEPGARTLVQRIGALRSDNGSTRCALRVGMIAASSEKLCSNRLPRETSVEVIVRCSALRRARPGVGLGESPLRIDRCRQLAGSCRKRAVQTGALQRLAALAEDQLGGLPVSGQDLDRTAHPTAQRRRKAELTKLVEDLAGAADVGSGIFELPTHRQQTTEKDQDVGLAGRPNRVVGE